MVNSQPLWKLAALALAVAACAPGIEQQDVGFLPASRAEDVAVQEFSLVVRNDYLGEVNVYAIAGSTRTRIGAVPAGSTAQLRIPRAFQFRPELLLQLDPVGPVEPFTYRPIAANPGTLIEFAIAPALEMSSHAILSRR